MNNDSKLENGFYFTMIGAMTIALGTALAYFGNFFTQAPPHLGVSIIGNYSGPLRPQVHYSPPKGFMNDPNGMIKDADGLWHLYYQYNPTDVVAGNLHWGHATSKDLYHWDNHPIALYPENPGEGIYSGAAVIDVNNTSGFFPNQTNGIIAMYTFSTPDEQTQDIAYSRDGGYTFTKYEGNPVLSVNSKQFRDPKVIWYPQTNSWVAVIAYSIEFTIGIYTSPDMRTWTHASNFSYHGLVGFQWECPNLIPMPVEGEEGFVWMLAVSLQPGAPLGGSITQYYPGSFNGTHFETVDAAARIADFGKDNYAGQWFYGIPDGEKQVSIAWASNWQYTNDVPTGHEGWRSAMTLPRENYFRKVVRTGWTLISRPYRISSLFDSLLYQKSTIGDSQLSVSYKGLKSNAVYIQINITNIPVLHSAGMLKIRISSSKSGEFIRMGQELASDVPFYIDLAGIKGFDNPFFTDKFSTCVFRGGDSYMFEAVIDRTIIETFLQDGALSATNLFYPTEPLDQVQIGFDSLNEGVKTSVAIWGLKSTWGGE